MCVWGAAFIMTVMMRIAPAARAAVLSALLPVFAAAQPEVVIRPGGDVVNVAPGSGANPAIAPGGNNTLIAPSVRDFQDRVQGLQNTRFNARQQFLDKFFENTGNGVAPVAPNTGKPRTPKAKPIKYKDLTIQRGNFSEKTDISEILNGIIQRADPDEPIDIAIHGLSLTNVTETLVKLSKDPKRTAPIRIIMNYSHVFPEKHGEKVSAEIQTLIQNLAKGRLEMRTLRGTGPYGVMHNKILIVGDKILKFGSFNWTKAAVSKNYENAVFNDDAGKIARYKAHYEDLWKIARDYADGPLTSHDAEAQDAAVAKIAAAAGSQDSVTYYGEKFATEMWSPKGGVKDAIVRAINATPKGEDIVVGMFSLNHPDIIDALIAADKRGVNLRIVVDKSQSVGRGVAPAIKKLIDAKIDIVWSTGREGHGVMHNKFAVFGRKLLIVGSFNWTDNAEEHNYENENFITDLELIQDFTDEFEDRYGDGTKPTPKEWQEVEQQVQNGHFDAAHD